MIACFEQPASTSHTERLSQSTPIHRLVAPFRLYRRPVYAWSRGLIEMGDVPHRKGRPGLDETQ
jgi:hypothetical protein